MNHYLDCEFLEGTQKENFPISLFRKNTPPTIDLISIGIVAEDGREFYAISKDFNLKEAWNRFDGYHESTPYEKQHGFSARKNYWIRENVLINIFYELKCKEQFPGINFIDGTKSIFNKDFNLKELKRLIKKYGKTNKQIAEEIQELVYGFAIRGYDENESQIKTTKKLIENFKEKVEFYAYYADYDWVVFCWLFGKMMDLPNGFPMYCYDLKQLMDEKAKSIPVANDLDMGLKAMKLHEDFPKQENEHSAIFDARFNKKLHEFLNNL